MELDRTTFPFRAKLKIEDVKRDPVGTLLPVFFADLNVRKLPITKDEAKSILSFMIEKIFPVLRVFPRTQGRSDVSPYGMIVYWPKTQGRVRLDGSRGRAMLAFTHEGCHAIGYQIKAPWFRNENEVIHHLALVLIGTYYPVWEQVA